MTEADLDSLAREILATTISELQNWNDAFQDIGFSDCGDPFPIYESLTRTGYTTFTCSYFPHATVKQLIVECERIFDEFTIELIDKQTGATTRVTRVSEDHEPASRDLSIRTMVEFALLHIISTGRRRLQDALDEGIEDAKVLAEAMLGAVVGTALANGVPGQWTGDARQEIDKAVERVANKKRDLLVGHFKKMPHIIAERQKRGGSDPRVSVSDAQCVKFAEQYPLLLVHWQAVASLRRQRLDWRGYAKLSPFTDTPDDLLDKLNDPLPTEDSSGDYPNIPSVLAYEHAGRRCAIPDNTYKLSSHKIFRSRGDKIRSQIKPSE